MPVGSANYAQTKTSPAGDDSTMKPASNPKRFKGS